MTLNTYQLDLFKKVTQIYAISGQESDLARFLSQAYQALGFELVRDNLGSVFALKKSKIKQALKVMVAGHMDEVGFIIIDIKENGMIALDPVGGINPQTLLAHRVMTKTKFGTFLEGSIDAVPPHLMNEADREKPVQIANMLVDFGFRSKAEAIEKGLYIGAMTVVKGEFVPLNDGIRLLSKAFDNRYGVVLGLDIANEIKDIELPYDLYIGATVQEEVGLRGATTISQMIEPDFAIVLDCSPARDSTGDNEQEGQLGGGVLLRYTDKSMLSFRNLIMYQEKMCEANGVKSQYYSSPGGTDAGAIHKANQGVLTLTHCICARNIHTCSSIIDSDDYLGARKVLLAILKDFNQERYQSLRK